jgi:hypothetical protein
MNYNGNEKLREDVATLSNNMYEMWQMIKQMERDYRYNSENLADRLAGNVIGSVENDFAKLYTAIADLDYQFKD